MDEFVARQVLTEFDELVCRWEVPEDQQIRGFDESRSGRQNFDEVTAVFENSAFTVDESDTAAARARISISVVERNEARPRAKLADIDRGLVLSADDDR
jgi:hypothetical protein